MRTLAQKRSEFALEKVLAITTDREGFKNFSAGMPAMILKNGFGHALAFCLAKHKDKHINMFEIVREWLSYNNGIDVTNTFVQPNNDHAEFIRLISQMDQNQYLAAQNESLKLLEWVKRYANAELQGGG